MFSARTPIGHSHQKRFGRNAEKRIVRKAPQEKLLQQDESFLDELLEVTVRYNLLHGRSYLFVKYLSPCCGRMFWLNYPDGRRDITCHFCGKKFILNIEESYD